MMSFLQRFAQSLLQRHPEGLHEVAVVLPSERAGLYLQRYLAQEHGGALWSPDILGVGAFLERTAELRQGQTMELLFLLYHTYTALRGPDADSLDRFLEWAPATLRDLSEVDAHLLELDALYKDLRNYHELEDWSFRLGELSPAQQRANTEWRATGNLHRAFQERMLSIGMGTSGFVARTSAERTRQQCLLPWTMIHFAGLNALDPATTATIAQLQEQGRATVAWDADTFYLDASEQEAGLFLRRSIAALGPGTLPPQNGILGRERHIHLVQAPHPLAQLAYVAQYLAELTPENRAKTAVVLAQEDLLLPLLERLSPDTAPVNVTMGHPLKALPIHGFTEAYLELATHAGSSGFLVDRCIPLFSHPFVQEGAPTTKIISALHENQRTTVEGDVITNMVHASGSAHAATIIRALNAALAPTDMATGLSALLDWASVAAPVDPLIQEQIQLAGNLQVRMDSLLRNAGIAPPDIRAYRAIRERLVREERMDFLGQPLQGLQVMGLLETRTVDHERLIMVGLNEGMLPRSETSSTWIPFDLRRHHGLPLPADAAAISAYNFQRAMQFPNQVEWVFCSGDEKKPGEPSRFVAQWRREVVGRARTSLSCTTVAAPVVVRGMRSIHVPKNEFVQRKLRTLFHRGLSPSALGAWLRCPLDFYFKYVAGIKEDDPGDGQLRSDVLGNAIHSTLQHLYAPAIGQQLIPSFIAEARERAQWILSDELAKAIPRAALDHGHPRLRREMAAKALDAHLESEQQRCASTPTVLMAVELEVEASLYNGVRLKGRCDRIIMQDGLLTVLDVKTGKVDSDQIKLPSLDRTAIKPDRQYALQLLIYLWAYLRQHPEVHQASAGVISLQRPSQEHDLRLTIGDEVVVGRQRLPAIEGLLAHLVEELLDPAIPFAHDPKSNYCTCCVGGIIES